MKLIPPVLFGMILFAATGCGENSFGGGGGRAGGGDQTGKSGDATPGDSRLAMDPPENPSKEQEAIGRCLKAWGKSPFDRSVYEDFRQIHAAVTVLGIGGNAVEDTEVTDGPVLTVISASVNVLGTANYVLMNPNGWYCMMVDVNVKAQTNIQVQCKAKLADSRVQVNVGSSASPNAAVGVNVLSDVQVERKPSKDSPSGC